MYYIVTLILYFRASLREEGYLIFLRPVPFFFSIILYPVYYGGGTEAVKIIDTSDSFKARLFPFEPEVLPHMHAASYGRIARPFANQSGHTTARTVTNHT